MITRGWVALLLFFATLVMLGFTLRRRSDLPKRQQKMYVFLISWQTLSLILLAYSIWPLSPFGLAQRSEVVNAFMNSLSLRDSETALNMITPAREENYARISNDLSNPLNFPVDWELEDPNRKNIVIGKATFSDNEDREVTMFLEWEWERARWGVSGVEFGKDMREGRVRFWLPETFLPYSWFIEGIVIGSIICILFSIRTVRKTNTSML
jgi:hypothetical protein